MIIYILDQVENIVGKGENANANYQCFFLKSSCARSFKVWIVSERVNPFPDDNF